MFSTIIDPVAPLTNAYLKNYARLDHEPDWSLTCLAYTLMKPRMENYHGISGEFITNAASRARMDQFLSQIVCLRNYGACDGFLYFEYYECLRSEDNEKYLLSAAKEAGLKRLEAVEKFVLQTANARSMIFIDEETRSAVVFILSNGGMKTYHLIISFLYTLFPKVFKDKPLSVEEVNLLKSLHNRNPVGFVTLMKEFLKPEEKMILKKELMSCFKGFRDGKIQAALNSVQQAEMNADELLRRYRGVMEQLQTAIALYEGLKVTEAESADEEETINYIVNDPRLTNVKYVDGWLYADIATLLTNFDVSKWNRAVARNNIFESYRDISQTSPFASLNARKILLNALFGSENPELAVRIRGRIKLDVKRAYMDVERGENYDSSDENMYNCITNPHYRLHGCPGRNRDEITQFLRQGDLISALECSIAATGGVNIDETEYTFRPFLQQVLTSDKKIIHRMSDGVNMTPAEALLWLLKQNEEKAA